MGAMQTVLDRMVSQADQEGVTLAEVVSRELSSGDLDRVQEYIRREMADNYAAIEGFMKDIEVTGTFDFSSLSEDELDECQENLRSALSDAPIAAESTA
jgi:hypothetical protein